MIFSSTSYLESPYKEASTFRHLHQIRNFLAKFWNWNGSGTERTLILGRGNGTELVPIWVRRIGTDLDPPKMDHCSFFRLMKLMRLQLIHGHRSIFWGSRSVPILLTRIGTSSVPFPLPQIKFRSVPDPFQFQNFAKKF